MTKPEDNKAAIQLAVPLLLATLLALLSVFPLSNAARAQGLSSGSTAGLLSAPEPDSLSITALDSNFGAYDRRQIERLGDLGRLSKSSGEFQQALLLFKQALHVSRINNGLYHESQLPIVDDIIAAEMALRNWESVDKFYGYQQHLYQRLYRMDDPRLEEGLRKISAWHVNALNVNLDGKRVEHLRKANKLFKLRIQIAENTQSMDAARYAVLAQNIKICERELFLASDLNREMMLRQPKDNQPRRHSYRQSERRLIVTLD